jgi:X-X-X-Leu-X-X-Gly heptad repeat protein
MKGFISFLIAIIQMIIFTSCHHGFYKSSSLNKEYLDASGHLMLLGRCTKQRLTQEPFNAWFTKNYNEYTVDTATAEKFRSLLADKQIRIFMGTWCGDSRREVPRMFKILDFCGVPSTRIQLILLNNADSFYKQDPAHDERGINIHRVPDLIVMDHKKEIGRIVESPVVSLENDLLKILKEEPYAPNYKAVAYLIELFRNVPLDSIGEGSADLSDKLSTLSSGVGELNTYGYVLMAAGEMQKAKIVFHLNTIIYPKNANVFDSFGEYYLKSGNTALARKNYEKVLEIEPSNENARKMIDQMK